jgi:hypothetical protein
VQYVSRDAGDKWVHNSGEKISWMSKEEIGD